MGCTQRGRLTVVSLLDSLADCPLTPRQLRRCYAAKPEADRSRRNDSRGASHRYLQALQELTTRGLSFTFAFLFARMTHGNRSLSRLVRVVISHYTAESYSICLRFGYGCDPGRFLVPASPGHLPGGKGNHAQAPAEVRTLCGWAGELFSAPGHAGGRGVARLPPVLQDQPPLPPWIRGLRQDPPGTRPGRGSDPPLSGPRHRTPVRR